MDASPRGREISYVEGRPSEIISRGNEIKNLGEKMRNSAEVLEDIKTRASDNQGEAIESLRESIGDSYKTLFEAADLYEPVGPVISTYGEELQTIQPVIKRHVDDCESLWSTYESLPGDKDRPGGAAGAMRQAGMSDEAREEEAEEDEAKQQAYDNWKAEAELFDSAYDTWENAFDSAVEGIGEEMAGSIEDSFWDNWGDVIDFIGEILSWASLVLGIAALIFGGWVLALIAVGVALAYLAVVAVKAANGQADWKDIGLAALGVLPVGKVTNLTKLAHLGKAPMGAVFKATGKGMAGNWAKLKPANGFQKLSGKVFSESAFKFQGFKAGLKNLTMGSQGMRSVRGEHIKLYSGARDSLVANKDFVRAVSEVDFGVKFLGNGSKIYGWGASAFGYQDQRSTASKIAL